LRDPADADDAVQECYLRALRHFDGLRSPEVKPWLFAIPEMLRKLDAETIRGLVAALPAVFREVIVLREVDDLSYREIAAIVSAPVGTVMSRLARGRAMLREAWLRPNVTKNMR
jgi:RNA polymerase sigma-70 factor (ECF subfamily)